VTEDNRRRNADAELERATACLDEARTLQASGLPYGAVSRAYYAVFHAARALLFSAGIEPRSHRALIALVGQHFVKPGRLSPGTGRLLSRMQRDREDADYVADTVFTDAEAVELTDSAAEFLDEVRRLLAAP
jgi:uncharacterized protein (UPF0332 family)